MSLYDTFIRNLEKKVGLSAKEISEKDPSEIREFLSKKTRSQLSIVSEFPFIGRGNVLRDGIISHKQINKEIDALLKI